MIERIVNDPYGFIYVITNNINGKRYVGQNRFSPKWEKYLGSGSALKRAIKKYGEESFSREIIDIAFTREELNKKEKTWINWLNARKSKNYYNLTDGGDGGNTIIGYTEEQRAAYSKKRSMQALENPNCKRGEFCVNAILNESQAHDIIDKLLQGRYMADIAREYNVNENVICDIRNKKTWKHLTKDITFPSYIKKTGNRKKFVSRYTLDGKFVDSYTSAREAERNTGVSYKLISACCRCEKISVKGYLWCFNGEEHIIVEKIKKLNSNNRNRKSIRATSLVSGEVFYFACAKDAVKELNETMSIEMIQRAARNNIDYNGYVWEYLGLREVS